MREHDEIGAAEERRDLVVGDEAGHEAHRRLAAARGLLELGHVHAERPADDPQLGALDLAESLEQQVDALVRADQAEEQGHRSLDAASSGGSGASSDEAGEVVEGPCGITWTRSGSMPASLAQHVRAPYSESATSASIRSSRRRWPARPPSHASARSRPWGVWTSGRPAGAAGRRGRAREPLEVDELGRLASPALEAQHVGEVLGGAQARRPQEALAARPSAGRSPRCTDSPPAGTGPWANSVVTSSTSAPARARAPRTGSGRTAACRPADRRSGPASASIVAVRLSYCVVNTSGREDLLACLDAIQGTHPDGIEAEVLVLDNASDDGSADAVRAWIAERGRLRRARAPDRARPPRGQGRERQPAAARGPGRAVPAPERGLRASTRRDRGAHRRPRRRPERRGRRRPPALAPRAASSACAWRLPGLGTAVASALFLHRFAGHARAAATSSARSAGCSRRRCSSAVTPPQQVGYLDPRFFVYSDETDFEKRLRDAGWTHPLRPRRQGRPPRAARDRPLSRRAPRHRVPPRPRRLHAKAPRPRRGGDRPGALGLDLRPPRRRRPGPPRPRRRLVLAARPPRPAPRPGRGPRARQPRPTTARGVRPLSGAQARIGRNGRPEGSDPVTRALHL